MAAEKGLYSFLLKRNATLIKITWPIDLAPAQVAHYTVVCPSRDPHPSPSHGGVIRLNVVVLASVFHIIFHDPLQMFSILAKLNQDNVLSFKIIFF